ncbi:uncharacterized protein METZ01_LOCUS295435, partial [marine metagenome]
MVSNVYRPDRDHRSNSLEGRKNIRLIHMVEHVNKYLKPMLNVLLERCI